VISLIRFHCSEFGGPCSRGMAGGPMADAKGERARWIILAMHTFPGYLLRLKRAARRAQGPRSCHCSKLHPGESGARTPCKACTRCVTPAAFKHTLRLTAQIGAWLAPARATTPLDFPHQPLRPHVPRQRGHTWERTHTPRLIQVASGTHTMCPPLCSEAATRPQAGTP